MSETRSTASRRESIAQLAQLSTEADRREFLTRHRALIRNEFVEQLAELLLSLWDVHDESTAQLMGYFYRRYIEGHDVAGSLQHAMQELRQTQPHPFYWAPFVLVGKLAHSTGLS